MKERVERNGDDKEVAEMVFNFGATIFSSELGTELALGFRRISWSIKSISCQLRPNLVKTAHQFQLHVFDSELEHC